MRAEIHENTVTNFGDDALYYHQKADVQKETARRLIKSLDPWKATLPAGPIAEIGCGTGFLSEGIISLFPGRELIISDASENMVRFCKKNVSAHNHITFKKHDACTALDAESRFALTISSFVAQWFIDPARTLAEWLEVTRPGGLLLAAFPGNESFPEWRNHTRTLGIPFTGNALPDTEEMVIKLSSGGTQVDYYEDTITQKFESAADFFRHLKNIGAGRQLEGRRLSPKEMRMLIDHWNEQEENEITVSWHVVFLAVKKNEA